MTSPQQTAEPLVPPSHSCSPTSATTPSEASPVWSPQQICARYGQTDVLRILMGGEMGSSRAGVDAEDLDDMAFLRTLPPSLPVRSPGQHLSGHSSSIIETISRFLTKHKVLIKSGVLTPAPSESDLPTLAKTDSMLTRECEQIGSFENGKLPLAEAVGSRTRMKKIIRKSSFVP
ncbi:uncharacterized protein I206_106993 [Kwoniella pini CBS 10737]|uniref:Uncharacterized protein n=1 Tax=Kwoniella pini CBS 10737 TaxID=1296096 RepID=A0A1B9HZJ4_9TREE|nr:uncharacterized protein I206_05464 [Kwoniella pini CBS 10737]OCF48684.1 hypothetical protein I206_05464 [Kwoniella pini CBS 10737]